MSDTATLIGTVPKNQREEVRISPGAFKGVDLIDIRVFVDDDSERHPTKKGVSVKIERLRGLIEVSERDEVEARRSNLIPGRA